MDEKQLVRTSKFLSLVLRHRPQLAGLTLDSAGWVSVEALLAGCASKGLPITRGELEEVVARNNKQRFAFDESGMLIRANQGHSVEVDLELEPAEPPDVLYHGTAERVGEAIRREGLKKMSRHHVHLSADVETARIVGARHGKPLVLRVNAGAMRAAGFTFHRSENGVWLVERVPPEYLQADT
ncbi:MAG: RNA 2'-phosphotransferase [Chloroflexia bacterium]